MADKFKPSKLVLALIVIWLVVIAGLFYFKPSVQKTSAQGTYSISFAARPTKESYYLSFTTRPVLQTNDGQDIIQFSPFMSIISICLLLAAILYVLIRQGFMKFARPVYYLAAFFLVFLVVAWRWLAFFNIASLTNMAKLAGNSLLVMGFGFAMILLCTSLGQWINGKIFKVKSEVEEINYLIGFGLGVLALSYCVYLLGMFGILGATSIAILLVISLVLGRSELVSLGKYLIKPVEIDKSYIIIKLLLITAVLVVLGSNVLEIMRPSPIGWDDSGVYLNIVNYLSSHKNLVSGYSAYYWEAFISQGKILLGKLDESIILTTSSAIMLMIGIYQLGLGYLTDRKYSLATSKLIALIASAIFICLPMMTFLLTKDIKTDIPSALYGCLALIMLLELFRSRGKLKKLDDGLIRYLILLGIFIGFAVMLKYTFIIFLVALLGFVVALFWSNRKVLALAIAIISLAAVAQVIPNAARNIVSAKAFSFQIAINGANPKVEPITQLLGFDEAKTGPIESISTQIDLQRFEGYGSKLRSLLTLPVTATFGKNIYSQMVDVGFLYFAFVLILPFIFLSKLFRERSSKLLLVLAFCTVAYWILWALVTYGVIWYGLAGFLLLGLVFAEILAFFWQARFLKYLILVIIGIWFVSILSVRAAYLPETNVVVEKVGLAYADGQLSETQYNNARYPDFYYSASILNTDLKENPNQGLMAYSVAMPYVGYHTVDNNEHVYRDDSLDLFNYVSKNSADNAEVLDRFKKAGFKYLIISPTFMSLDKTPEGLLVKRGGTFSEFIQANFDRLNLLVSTENIVVFQIK